MTITVTTGEAKSITETNAIINGTISHPSGVRTEIAGLLLGKDSANNMTQILYDSLSKYNISWANTTVPMNYNLNTECSYTLEPGTTYYCQYFVV